MLNGFKTALVVIRQEKKYGGYKHSLKDKLVIIARFVFC